MQVPILSHVWTLVSRSSQGREPGAFLHQVLTRGEKNSKCNAAVYSRNAQDTFDTRLDLLGDERGIMPQSVVSCTRQQTGNG